MSLSTRTQIRQALREFEKRNLKSSVSNAGFATESEVNALIAQYLMDNPVGGGVNTIQRGVVDLVGLSTTDTITPVDTTKSILLMSYSPESNDVRLIPTGEITNSTTLTFERSINLGTPTAIKWQVIEYT